ncbi:MAG: hypothetical protein FWC41_11050 [Firmicutes bacterium]|nr:hypothetical protein [Bacillota bacterium]
MSFFSVPLFLNDIKKGRADIKVSKNYVLAHISLSGISSRSKYNIYFFLGQNGREGIQKGFIVTNKTGNFSDTIRFSPQNTNISMNKFKSLTAIVLEPENLTQSEDIVGFKGARYDYKPMLSNQVENVENLKNKVYDTMIESKSEYWPFLSRIDNMKIVKINSDEFESLNLEFLKDTLKNYAINSLKFYGFLIFGRCIKNQRSLYILGIPDKYNRNQVISMANMGSRKFYPMDLSKSPQNGDLGFWIINIDS